MPFPASPGIFVGGTIALIPSRRKDISELGWKALFVGTLATMMIACIAGTFDTGDSSILGTKTAPAATIQKMMASVAQIDEILSKVKEATTALDEKK